MKLKTYIIPDFRTIEVRAERFCEEIIVVSIGTKPGKDDGETDEIEAPIFRDGIWDEE